MLYLRLLEESFVSQLCDGECSFKGLFNRSPRPCRRLKSSKQIVKYENADQECLAIVEGDRAKLFIKIEHIESPCCGSQQDGKVHSMNDNASIMELVEEATSNARATSTGQSSACYSGKHKHSPSRSAEGLETQEEDATKSD
uniref:Uncharacterized protein n=1 Tax=Arundo donax TaxID=35708 RepID=A0A0A9G664_ARUDO